MSSCWQEDPHSRPTFSQICTLLYQTSVLENVVYNDKKRLNSNSGSENACSEDEPTVYTYVLSNPTMYEKYREIQNTNSAYMEMNAKNNYVHPTNCSRGNDEKEHEFETVRETDLLQKDDDPVPYCHYVTLKSQNSVSNPSIHDNDSGASTGHNLSVFDDTVISELTNNSQKDVVKLGRLQSLNEVEEENQC